MRRLAVGAALTVAGVVAFRTVAPRLHARLVGACERMFDEMPESFPPKRMLRGIEEMRVTSARTLELLEERGGHDRASPIPEPDERVLTAARVGAGSDE